MIQKTQTIDWKPFSEKHKAYIRKALCSKMSVAEGSIRSGKTIDNCIIAAAYLEKCKDKIHLASGSTIGNAKLNIGAEKVVEDVNGVRTREYVIKRKLMLQVYGIRIREV